MKNLDDINGGERDPKVRKISSPLDDLEDDDQPTVVKQDASLQKIMDQKYIASYLPRFNPKKGTENCLPCVLSFLRWVNTGELKEAPLVSPVQSNFKITKDYAELIDYEAADTVPNGPFVIVLGDDKAYDCGYIDVDSHKKIVFKSTEFKDLETTLNKIQLKKGQGGEFATGLLFCEYLEEDLKKRDKNGKYVVDRDHHFEGHFLNFYIYKVGEEKKILIIDPQTKYNVMVRSFQKLATSYKSKVFIWSDNHSQPAARQPSPVKEEPISESSSSSSVDEVGQPPNKRFRNVGAFQEEPANTNAPAVIQVVAAPVVQDNSGEILALYNQYFATNSQQANTWFLYSAAEGLFDMAHSAQPADKATCLKQATGYADQYISLMGQRISPEKATVLAKLFSEMAPYAETTEEEMRCCTKAYTLAERGLNEAATVTKSASAVAVINYVKSAELTQDIVEKKRLLQLAGSIWLNHNWFILQTLTAENLRKVVQALKNLTTLDDNNKWSHAHVAADAAENLLNVLKGQATDDDYFLAAEMAVWKLKLDSDPTKTKINNVLGLIKRLLNFKGRKAGEQDYKLAMDGFTLGALKLKRPKEIDPCAEKAAGYAEGFLKCKGQVTVEDYCQVATCFSDLAEVSEAYGHDFNSKAVHYAKLALEQLGDQPTVVALKTAGSCFHRFGNYSTKPEEKFSYLDEACKHYAKILEIKKDQAEVEDYDNASRCLFHLGSIPTHDSYFVNKRNCLVKAAEHANTVLDKKGDQAKASELDWAAGCLFVVGLNEDTPAQKLNFFQKALVLYKKAQNAPAFPEEKAIFSRSIAKIEKEIEDLKKAQAPELTEVDSRVARQSTPQAGPPAKESLTPEQHAALLVKRDKVDNFLRSKGAQATSENYKNAAKCYLRIGHKFTAQTDKKIAYDSAAKAMNILLTLKPNEVTKSDYNLIGSVYFWAGKTTDVPEDKLTYTTKAAIYGQKGVDLKKDEATVKDYLWVANQFAAVFKLLTTSSDKIENAIISIAYYKKALDKETDATKKEKISNWITNLEKEVNDIKMAQAPEQPEAVEPIVPVKEEPRPQGGNAVGL